MTTDSDPNIRDNSGKRADQYLIPKSNTNASKNTNAIISSQRKTDLFTENIPFSRNSEFFGSNLRQKGSHHSLLVRPSSKGSKYRRKRKTDYFHEY